MFYRPKFTIPCDHRSGSQHHSLSISCVFVMRGRSEDSHFLSKTISAFFSIATGIRMKISIQFFFAANELLASKEDSEGQGGAIKRVRDIMWVS